MGYVKNAMIAVQEAGCLWVDDAVIERLRDAGHEPKVKRVVVEGYNGPVEIDAILAPDGMRLMEVADEDDAETIADALAELIS
jgi:hypothetical protein